MICEYLVYRDLINLWGNWIKSYVEDHNARKRKKRRKKRKKRNKLIVCWVAAQLKIQTDLQSCWVTKISSNTLVGFNIAGFHLNAIGLHTMSTSWYAGLLRLLDRLLISLYWWQTGSAAYSRMRGPAMPHAVALAILLSRAQACSRTYEEKNPIGKYLLDIVFTDCNKYGSVQALRSTCFV